MTPQAANAQQAIMQLTFKKQNCAKALFILHQAKDL
jgi:hypothetical protein